MMFLVKKNTPTHPLSGNERSTLTDRVFTRSRFGKPYNLGNTLGKKKMMRKAPEWDEVQFTEEQEKIVKTILKKVKDGEDEFHIHLSGPAGTGKSVVLRYIAEQVRRHYALERTCLIAAPTGLAAVNVGGQTIHSILSIIPNEPIFSILPEHQIQHVRGRVQGVRLLILDEVSLMSAVLLAQIDHRLQQALQSTKPFGGVSVLAVGDLAQLPPVVPEKNHPGSIFENMDGVVAAVRDTATPHSPKNLWDLFELMELTHNIRTQDREAANLLSQIRTGSDTPQIRGFLHRVCRLDGSTPKEIITELKTLRRENPGKSFAILAAERTMVEEINRESLRSSSKQVVLPVVEVEHHEGPGYPFRGVEAKSITVAIGSRIMVNKNIDHKAGIVNGMIGELVEIGEHFLKMRRIDKNATLTINQAKYEKGVKKWLQFPVELAEAMTVHRSQGMTFDGCIIHTARMFMKGQFYTALSRSRRLDLCRITGGMDILEDRRTSKLKIICSKKAIAKLAYMKKVE